MATQFQKHVLQWHITHRCNLHCTHCYQEDRAAELSFSSYSTLFQQYLDFCAALHFKGHINLTGGEPLLSAQLFPLLDLFEQARVTFGLLSNGTCITGALAEKLAKYSCLRFVQVSIDGTRTTHDAIRGAGSFDRACEGLRHLRRAGIQTMAAFTCHQRNYHELKAVIRLMRRQKVDRFWADRLVPIGGCGEDILTTAQFHEMLKVLTKEHERRLFSHTDVHLNRAMQFLEGGSCCYHCAAGTTLLTLLADGTLLPCRRLPLPIGNCLTDGGMLTLYRNSPLIAQLRKEEIPEACTACPKAHQCRGGAKCLTYAVTGKLCGKDINCDYLF